MSVPRAPSPVAAPASATAAVLGSAQIDALLEVTRRLAAPFELHPMLREVSAVACGLLHSERAIEEVVMNLVLHAFDDACGRSFRLRLRRLGDELQFDFEDDRRDFDPTVPAAAPKAASLDEIRPGGLGLPLLRKRTRGMRHTRRDGRNRLTIAVALGEGG